MRIAIAGASGLIGQALIRHLKDAHSILKFVRHKEALQEDERYWDPAKGIIEAKDLEGCDALINISGENISSGRWTEAKKRRIRDSRVQATHLLCETIARLKTAPKVLINASAVGFYGNRGEEILTEASSEGMGFLPEVCRAWEEATQPAERAGVRVVLLRFGVVLSREGGALPKMLGPFKWGLGGVVGNGEQYMSWIAIDELVRIVAFALENTTLTGACNAVSPHPVTNREFTHTLGAVLNRPTVMPLPAFAVRLLFGEMGQELLLSSTRAVPDKLLRAGYVFQAPDLKQALDMIMDKHS